MLGEQLHERIAAIGALLRAWQPLWHEQAFCAPTLAWEREHPALARALRSLGLEQSERLHADPGQAAQWLAAWLPLSEWLALEAVPAATAHPLQPWPHGFERDVPGRKWAQVEAFVRALGSPGAGLGLLDWCAGKGHLARAIAQQQPGCEVVVLERDAALLMEGVRLARRAGLSVRPVRCDVLDEAAAAHVQGDTHVVALHACGHLHQRLFELAATQRPRALSCAPCCYHLGGEAAAQPRSAAGRASWPGIVTIDTRTAVQETVTADSHVRRRRRRLQEWQLGFDLLAREIRGRDEYLPIPAVESSVLRSDFAGFCLMLARRKGLELPPRCDFARYEAAGRERFVDVCALDLVRHRFRRLLELWLVLDRALALEECGYRVQLVRFCDRALSPRDLLLQARLD